MNKILDNEIWILIDKIDYHLSWKYWSFLYEIHENLFFNIEKYNELLKAIKSLKNNKINPCLIWNLFILNILEKITYLYDTLRDLYVHKNKMNINIDEFYTYILELKYEIESLFNDNIIEDYNWNKY